MDNKEMLAIWVQTIVDKLAYSLPDCVEAFHKYGINIGAL